MTDETRRIVREALEELQFYHHEQEGTTLTELGMKGDAALCALRARIEELEGLVRKAATESCTTSGDFGGPGCFYCDTEEGHAASCPAAAALSEEPSR